MAASQILIMYHLLKKSGRLFQFSSKKLGIADTAKVIQDKILNFSQVVSGGLRRTT